ncbi:glycosyl transferase [Marinicauda salina]|uniref:Glycosyl transferase n=1 Tax=Marinicauda salina TaxID=2135793 RepID=A0A2U2BV79_9PROT|nr:glycosyltransferase family 2 protein [Marinicauda salina]PWE17890.1 glycosyl transferase [Marinicauda salina]
MPAPRLSVVIPAFNEAESIETVVREALDVLSGGAESFEIVVVDDGSADDTAGALADLAGSDDRVRVIRHPRRSGKSAALRTGVLAARADWVATMDGDGQDDPRSVLAMAEAVDFDAPGAVGLVAGIRSNRTDGESRRLASRFANGLRRAALNDDCPDTACGLKLFPRDVFLALPFFDALHRYLPALIRHLGFETRNVTVENRPRAAGESKYSNIGRAFAGLFDLMGVMWLMRRTHVPSTELLACRDREG